MKTSILFLAMFIATGYCYAVTEHDTKDSLCCYTADSLQNVIDQDSFLLNCDTTLLILNETVTVKRSKHKYDLAKKRKRNLANINQQKWPGWLDATLDAVGAAFLWLASPVRLVWGDYTEAGQNFFYDKI